MRRSLVLSAALALAIAGACSDFEEGTEDPAVDAGPDEPTEAAVDAPVPEAATPDADADAATPTCKWDDPFQGPVAIQELNTPTGNEGSARLTPDEKVVYFHRAPYLGQFDLFVARRASAADTFGMPILVPGLATGVNEIHPMVTADELTLLFSRLNAGTNYDLWAAYRQDAAAPFADASALAPLNSNLADQSSYLSADEKTLVYYSASGTGQLFTTSFPVVDGGVPIERALPNATDWFPVLTADELTLYFASRRAGGNDQIYVAHRMSKAVPFSAPILVPAIFDPTAAEYPAWISPDSCRLYMGSTRSGSQSDIYVARRFPK